MTTSAHPPAQAARPPDRRDLTFWRERTLQALLRTTILLGLIAYLPSVWLAGRAGIWSIVVVDSVVYAWLIAVTLWPGASHRLRVVSLTTVAYVLGVVLLVRVGLTGSGLAWLSSAPVFVSVLMGLRPALVALGANLAILAGVGTAIASGLLVYASGRADGGMALFLIGACNATLLSAALSVSVGVLLDGLQASHRELTYEIEERARAEAEQHRLEARLREAHKLEAVGRLASGVAHDFNNLLVPILANAQELRRRAQRAAADADLGPLDDIVLSAERGRTLVQRVLALGRRSVATRRQVVVAEVLREAAQLLRAGLRADVVIAVEVTHDDVKVFADPVELHQVVMNLATNAAHAMRHGGGRLTLRQDVDDDGTVAIHVVDTGEGMGEPVRQRALEPFFTTKSVGEGSGLGLSTAYAIVGELGGRLEIASEPGQGTVVVVRLPIAPGRLDTVAGTGDATPTAAPTRDPMPAAPPDAPAVSPDTARRRVLVVDDEELVLKTCAMVLGRLGYDVQATTDPHEAAAIVRTGRDRIDLLITDKAMPGLDGLALARQVRRLAPTLPIIVATGYLDEATAVQVEELGGASVIMKPYRIEDLAAAAADALGTHAAPAPPMS